MVKRLNNADNIVGFLALSMPDLQQMATKPGKTFYWSCETDYWPRKTFYCPRETDYWAYKMDYCPCRMNYWARTTNY
jgi:hypothetical protein